MKKGDTAGVAGVLEKVGRWREGGLLLQESKQQATTPYKLTVIRASEGKQLYLMSTPRGARGTVAVRAEIVGVFCGIGGGGGGTPRVWH